MKNRTIISVIFLFIIISCKESKNEPTKALKATVSFLKGKVLVNQAKATLGQVLHERDEILTGKKGNAIISIAGLSKIIIRPGSELKISSLNSSDKLPQIALSQGSGTTFHKVTRGKSEYEVKTPAAVAGVRGTSFSVKVSEEQTMVRLLEGRVKVSDTKSNHMYLAAGQKIRVGKKELGEPEPMKSTSDLEAMNQVNDSGPQPEKLLSFLQGRKAEAQVSRKAQEDIVQMKKIIIEPDTHLGLRKKYGRLYDIKTKSGLRYIGALKQKNNTYTIILPGRGGHIKLTRNEIKAMKIIPE